MLGLRRLVGRWKRRLLESLIVSNVVERPGRVLASMLGVAVSVVLILVTVGLARGMLQSTGEREGALGAEILFQPPGTFGPGVGSTPLSMPVAYARGIAEIPGVRGTTPVGRYIRSGGSGLGFELIEGVVFSGEEYASYPEITGIHAVSGRFPERDDELLVDRIRAEEQGSEVGSTMELLGRTFTVVGIFEPEVGARIKVPLSALQDLLGNPDKASWILVKCASPHLQDEVALRIEEQFPGNQIIFTRDIPSFYTRGLPSLTVFLNVVIGLAIGISTLVILLAMYTAVHERTREIGILKALGASRGFIVSAIEAEALLISVLGVALGFAVAALLRAGIIEFTTLTVDFEVKWALVAAGAAFFAGTVGALYPAMRAAKQDPIQALSYE